MERKVEPFASYIPMDRRIAMADGATLGNRASGAVLFADISGFTPLTEILYQELGPQRGADELNRLLNQVYDALIGRVHHFRGVVIGFSGDAITCLFNGDDGLWATACALQMQEVMAQIGEVELPSGSSLKLAIKAAVTAGRVWRLVVGDQQRQLLDIIAGDTLDRAIAAEKIAGKGEVLIGPGALKYLDGRVQLAGSRTDETGQGYSVVEGLMESVQGRPWLELPADALNERQFQPWILPLIYERLSTGHAQFLAELRNNVALFLKFCGLDYEHDAAVGEKLDRFIRRAQSVLAYYEGSLLNLTVGDKGSYLLATFGAPLAHEDDARRAIETALDLLALTPEMDGICDLQIGISQGLIFSGAYGGSQRRTYGVLGAETNTAARLMEKAEPGQILVTSRISQAAAESHRFEVLAPVKVKGISDPVPVCRLLGRKQRPEKRFTARATTEIVGRKEERQILAERLGTLQKGEPGGAIVIEGEAGIGKSRLLEDLLQKAEARKVPFFIGAGDAIEKNAAYHAYRAVFWDYFDLDAAANSEISGAGRLSQSQTGKILKIIQTTVPQYAHLAPLLDAVLPIDLPDTELIAQMSGEVRAGNTRDLLVGLLKARAESESLLLVLEDAHWLDSASWALTRYISREITPLALVIATRPIPDPLPNEYDSLLRRPTTQNIFLETLPPQQTLQLVCQRLGVETLPEPASKLLLEKGSGHPFFSEELAYALRDTGLLKIENGEARLVVGEDELQTLSFPDSIDSVITSRIDLLTAQQQLTLKVASVIGRVFAYATLRGIYPVQAEKSGLLSQLHTLERLDITPVETPEPELSYIFKHIITQEVAYNLMSFAQRQQLHQAVAGWLEEIYHEDLAPYYPLLAHHWGEALSDQYGRSDLVSKTLEYLEKAAEQSLDNFANREAANYYRDLLHLDDLLTDPVDLLRRARWQRGLGEANLRLGNWKDANENLEAALGLLGHPIPSNTVSLILKTLGQAAKQAAYRLRGIPAFAAELKHEEKTAILEAAHAYRALLLVLWFREEPNLFLYSGLANVNLAERLGLSPELVEAFSNLGAAIGSIPIHSFARAYQRWTIDMASEIEDNYARAWAFHTITMYTIHRGDWTVANELLIQGSEMCNRIGFRRLWDESWGMLAILLHRRGKFLDSKKHFADVYASANSRDDGQPQLWGLIGQAENELWLHDDAGKIISYLNEAKDLLSAKNISLNDHVRTHGVLAKAYLRAGNDQLAHDEARTALNLTKEAKIFIPYSYEGYVAPTEVFLTLWENNNERSLSTHSEIANLAKEGLKFANKLGGIYPVFKPRALIYQGCFDWLSGKQQKALKAWKESAAFSQELGMPHEEGLANFEIGRHLPSADPESVHYLERAIDLFTQVEAAYYVDRAQSELDKTLP
jgi:class 3 adenylate cyclase